MQLCIHQTKQQNCMQNREKFFFSSDIISLVVGNKLTNLGQTVFLNRNRERLEIGGIFVEKKK